MARIRSRPQSGFEDKRDDLVESVVRAIKDEEQQDGPVIFEVASGSTDFVQVIVVWERWSDLSADIRSRIVTEAYQQVEAQDPEAASVDRISTIIPITVGQALEMGVLPYSVQCGVHRSASHYEQIKRLMRQEGALETGAGIELRLPTEQLAKAARERLQEATKDMEPEVHWQIAQQMGRIIEY